MERAETGRISYAGREAEKLFERLVPFALPSSTPSRGDVRVVVDETVHYVEVKTCRVAVSGTINQARAIKYLTIAVHAPTRRVPWIVLPAHVVLRRVAVRARGQHSEVAFENSTLTLAAWVDAFACTEQELPDRVAEAIRAAAKFPELKRSMDLLLYDLKRLSYRTRDEVRQILAGARPSYWEDP